MPPKLAARSVFTNATAVTESTRNSLPALKPYQPNQRRPVPSATSGMECGPLSATFRRPTYSTDASAAMPAMLCTTMPPAKSSTPQLRHDAAAPDHVHEREVDEHEPRA